MSAFGESYYGEAFYSAGPYRTGELLLYTVARVIKPISESPLVFDSLIVGLAQRFNWLQQGIQTFGLANKIEYATGSDLDDQWGRVYNLPRLAGESDSDYRIRLQTYVSVLVGSGTVPNLLPILNFVVGLKTGVVLQTRWPAQVVITGDDLETLQTISQRRSLLESILPGMFAAGVDYSIVLPFAEFYTVARVVGDRSLDLATIAALQTDISLTLDTEAALAVDQSSGFDTDAAVQADRFVPCYVKATVRADRVLELVSVAAAQGDCGLALSSIAALQADNERMFSSLAAVRSDNWLEVSATAAVAKTFERRLDVIASVWRMASVELYAVAAVQSSRELGFQTVARVRKP